MISDHGHLIRAEGGSSRDTMEARCVAMAERARERLEREAALRPMLRAEMRKAIKLTRDTRGDYAYGTGVKRVNGRSVLTPDAMECVKAYMAERTKRPTFWADKAGIARATLCRHARILAKGAK